MWLAAAAALLGAYVARAIWLAFSGPLAALSPGARSAASMAACRIACVRCTKRPARGSCAMGPSTTVSIPVSRATSKFTPCEDLHAGALTSQPSPATFLKDPVHYGAFVARHDVWTSLTQTSVDFALARLTSQRPCSTSRSSAGPLAHVLAPIPPRDRAATQGQDRPPHCAAARARRARSVEQHPRRPSQLPARRDQCVCRMIWPRLWLSPARVGRIVRLARPAARGRLRPALPPRPRQRGVERPPARGVAEPFPLARRAPADLGDAAGHDRLQRDRGDGR